MRFVTPTNHNGVGHVRHRRTKETILDRGSRRHDHTSANAQKSYHSYLALAREAASRGDTIAAENFYQHAEHFLRLLKEPTL